jgi:hypothetical protein
MAAEAIRREYPVALIATLNDPADLALPRELTPAFCGSFDWHSAVHGHWTLARAVRLDPDADWAGPTRAALAAVAHEREPRARVRVRRAPPRIRAAVWTRLAAATRRRAAPVGGRAGARVGARTGATRGAGRAAHHRWAEKLPFPIRSGEHGQSAFAFGLALDWSRDAQRLAYRERLEVVCSRLYRADVSAPVEYEPSGHDFLSPALGEADLMRRVLQREAYTNWIYNFLPDARDEQFARWLEPVTPPDRSDGQARPPGRTQPVARLDAAGHRERVARRATSSTRRSSARRHGTRRPGLEGARGDDWMGTHWLASFATYLLTERGLR